MKVSIHTIGQMTLEALQESLKKEINLQTSRKSVRQNWTLADAIQAEIEARQAAGVTRPLSLEDYL